MADGAQFRIEPLGDRDRKAFASGEESVDRWFHTQASQMSSRGLAAVHVMIEQATGDLVGYYALSNFTVVASALPESLGRRLPKQLPIPAHLIGQLGIDARHHGKGYGHTLLYDALRRAERQTTQSASFGVVVHALTPQLALWYERIGFRHFPAHPLHLIISMVDIRAL